MQAISQRKFDRNGLARAKALFKVRACLFV